MRSAANQRQFLLGDLYTLSNGVNAGKSSYGSGVPFANVLEVIKNEALDESKIPGRVRLSPRSLTNYEVRHGDVLFNRTSETQEEVGLASVYVGTSPVVFGGFVLRGRPRTAELDVSYAKYALRASAVRTQVTARGQGGIRANIGQRDLSSVLIELPDLATQRAVARLLDDVSSQCRSLERLIAKKRAIKQGMMQELLTGQTRLRGFTDEWSTRSLSTFGGFLRGSGIKRDEVRRSGVACIRYGEIYTTFKDYASSTVSFVSESVAATALPLRSGDILFAGSGETKAEIGMNVAYIGDAPAVAGGDIIVLRGTDYDPVYLSSLLNMPEVASQKARGGQGDAVVHINWRVLAGLEVTVPPLSEQHAIAQVLIDADDEIAILERRLEATRAIKQGMMQELLTGRTRLVVKEDAA